MSEAELAELTAPIDAGPANGGRKTPEEGAATQARLPPFATANATAQARRCALRRRTPGVFRRVSPGTSYLLTNH